MKRNLASFSLFLGILFLFLPQQLQASPPFSTSLHYECLGGCHYRVHVDQYSISKKILPPPLPGPANAPYFYWNIDSTCGFSPDTLGSWTSVSYTIVTPICPGPAWGGPFGPNDSGIESRYYRDYDLCAVLGCSSVKASWGHCCRTSTVAGQNQGLHIETEINLGLSPCNSSPRFDASSIMFLPEGITSTYNFSATDLDGDSLVYYLSSCFQAPNMPISHPSGNPYNPQDPFQGIWQVQLDSHTGQLTFLPTPGTSIIAAMCVSVDEYRNGVKIGSTTRDLTIVTHSWVSRNFLPQFDSTRLLSSAVNLGNNTYEILAGDSLNYYVQASDSNLTDSLSLLVDYPVPGLHLQPTGINPISAQLNFQSTDTGMYVIGLRVSDNYCPFPGFSHHIIRVRVVNPYLKASITEAPCGQATGAIDLSVRTNDQYQVLWSTGDTTEDISNLFPGIYSVTVSNNMGLFLQDTFVVSANNIVLTDSLISPTCSNSLSGSILTHVQGSVGPYTYLWNTGDTTASLNNIPAGGYSVTLWDSYGCPRHKAFILPQPDSCFNVISGKMYQDLNSNCIFDAGDIAIANRLVDIQPGGAVFTDVNGAYSFHVDTGTFVLEARLTQYQQAICPQGGKDSVTFTQIGNIHQGLDFAIKTDSVQDLRVSYSQEPPRPGRAVSHYVRVNNDGAFPQNGQLSWTHDTIFTYQSAIPPPTSYNPVTRTATWNVNPLSPFGTGSSFQISTQIPPSIALNIAYLNTAKVDPILGDSIPTNNVTTFSGVTRAAYDPNDKQVSPAGLGALGLIEQGQKELNYTIRFQNTGNDTAFFVVLRDTLSQDLNVFSFQSQLESHPYSLFIEKDSILVFTFSNILLPDSSTNLAESQGFVSFSLGLQDSLPVGTQIRNRAAIYFDFNPPVITNEVVNTLFTYPKLSLSNDSSICVGEPLQTTVSQSGMPPYSFYWSDGYNDLGNFSGVSSTNISTTGVYSVVLVDAFGIRDTVETYITALPLADADFTFTAQALNVLFNGSSQANANWSWDFGDGQKLSGQQQPTHVYANFGVYQVTLVTENDCGVDTVTQRVNISLLGIGANDVSAHIQIVPHPVKDISYLRFENTDNLPYSLHIFDLQGRLIRAYSPQRGSAFEISRDGLAAGVYMYELKGEKSYFGKVVVR